MHIVMARARRTGRCARSAAFTRWHQEKFEVSALRMAYAIMVEGARPEQIREVFKRCGIILTYTPSALQGDDDGM